MNTRYFDCGEVVDLEYYNITKTEGKKVTVTSERSGKEFVGKFFKGNLFVSIYGYRRMLVLDV